MMFSWSKKDKCEGEDGDDGDDDFHSDSDSDSYHSLNTPELCYRYALQKWYQHLEEDCIENSEGVVSSCFSNSILNMNEKQKLQCCKIQEGLYAHDKMLVDIMLTKSEKTMAAFVDVLRDDGQGRLADKIQDRAGEEGACNIYKSGAGNQEAGSVPKSILHCLQQNPSAEFDLAYQVRRLDSEGSYLEENVKLSSRQLSSSSVRSGLSMDGDRDVSYGAIGGLSKDEVQIKDIAEHLLPESEEKCSMEKPIPFVVTNMTEGKLELNPEAVDILSKGKQPVCVISIVGKYRTGKSYIMNRFFNINEGFPLGNSVEAKTKGIWMWLKPHPSIDNQYLLLLDTEGMYDAKKIDSIQDQNMFCLCLLLSSCLVYNVIGVLDKHVMEQLHFVTELTKHIKVKENVDEDGSSFSEYFPDFCFLLRDFFLDLQSDGQSVDSNGYMEDILGLKENNDKNTHLYNEPRECIKTFFRHRRCYTLGKPVESDYQLKHLEKMKNEDLEPLFIEKSKSIVEDIMNNTKPLCVKTHKITCSQLTSLAGIYIRCINESSAPCISSAVERLRVIESTQALEKAISIFVIKMAALFETESPTPVEQDVLQKYRDQASSLAISEYQKMSFYDKDLVYENKLLENIENKYREIMNRNNKFSRDVCTKLIEECFMKMDKKLKQSEYLTTGGYEKYNIDKENAVKKYKNSPNKGSMAENVLVEYMEKLGREDKIVLDADKALTETRRRLYQETLQRKQQEQRALLTEMQNMNLFMELQRQEEKHCQMIVQSQEENKRQHAQSVKEFEENLQKKEEKYKHMLDKGLKEQSIHYKLQIEEMKAKYKKQEDEHEAQMSKLQEQGQKSEEQIQQLRLQQITSQQQIEQSKREIAKLKYEQLYNDGINKYRDMTKQEISLKQYVEEEQKAWSYFVLYTEGNVQQHREKWQGDIIDITMIERKDVQLLIQKEVDLQGVNVSLEETFAEDKDHFLAKDFQRVFRNEKLFVGAILQYKTGIPYNKSLEKYIEQEKCAWETFTSNADGDTKCYIERWQEEVVNITVKKRKEVYLLIEKHERKISLENLFQNHSNHYLVREFQSIYENQRLMDKALQQYETDTSGSRTLTEYILLEEKAWRQFTQGNNKGCYRDRWQERIIDITTTDTKEHSLIRKELAENYSSFEDMTDKRINHYLIKEFKKMFGNDSHFENAIQEYQMSTAHTTSIEDYYKNEKSAWRSFTSKAKGLTDLYQDKWQERIIKITMDQWRVVHRLIHKDVHQHGRSQDDNSHFLAKEYFESVYQIFNDTEVRRGYAQVPALREGEQYHVFIAHSRMQSEFVEGTLRKILQEDYHIKCCDVDEDYRPGVSVVINTVDCIRKSRKVIMLVSKAYLESGWTNFEIGEAIQKEGKTQKASIIPILWNDILFEDLPTYLRRSNILELDGGSEHFWKKLIDAVADYSSRDISILASRHRPYRAQPVEAHVSRRTATAGQLHSTDQQHHSGSLSRRTVIFMKDKTESITDIQELRLPIQGITNYDETIRDTAGVGNLADGLAWSYYYGFLKLVLPGLIHRANHRERFNFPKEAKTYKTWEDIKHLELLPRMMIIMPKSGFCPPNLTDGDENIQFVCHIPHKAHRAGNIQRDYKSSVYSVKGTSDSINKEVLVIAEFATPLMAMYEKELHQLANFSEPERLHQKMKFEEKVQEILEMDDECQGAFCFLQLEDKRDKEWKPIGWSLSQKMSERAFNELAIIKRAREEREAIISAEIDKMTL